MMELETSLRQCCKIHEPVWIFCYSDGSFFAICDNYFYSEGHRVGVTKIIDMRTRNEYTPEQAFEKENL